MDYVDILERQTNAIKELCRWTKIGHGFGLMQFLSDEKSECRYIFNTEEFSSQFDNWKYHCVISK